MEIYKDIAAGTAQINPLSDYFQESENDMKSMSPFFQGRGYSRPIHYQMPFSCKDKPSNVEDMGCDSSLNKNYDTYMEAEDPPEGWVGPGYDYSTNVFFDYSTNREQNTNRFMTLCDPLNEDVEKCQKRIFECGENETWGECVKKLKNCPGTNDGSVCKYSSENKLIKKFTLPQSQVPPPESSTIPVSVPSLRPYLEPIRGIGEIFSSPVL